MKCRDDLKKIVWRETDAVKIENSSSMKRERAVDESEGISDFPI